ncbi:chymotrypsinogen B-like isoform X4 [Oculina patagonica]
MLKILAITLCVVVVASLRTNEGRHHIISSGHLKPPEEPFFTADIEPVEPDLNAAEEKREEELQVNQDQHPSDSRGATGHKMPPPKGPLRDIKPPSVPLDEGSSSCGRSSSSSSRVVNGADATLGEWPWQARLQFNHNHLCGGTLIMPEWVMTAAHCVLHNDTSKLKVILGDVDRIKTEGSEQEFEVKRIVKHRLFSHPVPYENDIALFQLSRPADLSDLVNTACLPGFLEEVPVGTECYITGWGQMFGEVQESAPILQQARMPVVSNGACAAKLDTSPNGGLHTDNRTWIVTSKMICAGDAGKTKTHGCFGDSGGPFQCRNTAGQWVVQGIVSWGDPDCSSRNHYTVFTRVSVFRGWLEDVMANIRGIEKSKYD